MIRKTVATGLLSSLPFYAQAFAEPVSPLATKVQRHYPAAQVKYVNLAEFEKLKAQYGEQGLLIADAAAPTALQPHPDTYDPCRGETAEIESGGEEPSPVFVNFMSNTRFDNGKDVLIFFAVIGVVVVAALVVYTAGFLWRATTAGFQCRVWSQWGLRFSYISDHTDTQVRRGTMSGGFFSLGYKIPAMTMALTAELGHLNMDLKINSTGTGQKLHGVYALLGPSFDIPFSPRGHSFQIELLAGTAAEEDIGLMSTLRFGLDFKMTPRFRLGLSFGAALINVKTFKGFITDLDQVNYLSGATVGYRF